MNEAFLRYLSEFIDEKNILPDEPMSKHTTFRTGGKADALIKVSDVKQLKQLIAVLNKVEYPFYIVGNGSNILVGDKGYDGVIVKIAQDFDNITIDGNMVTAMAGARMSAVAQKAAMASLSGLEFASGIPGTIGGGVMMNAGAYDGEMKQVVKTVSVLDREGNELNLDNETMEFGYRTSVLKRTNHIVTEVVFELKPGNREEIISKMEDFNQRRRDKQPLEYPSAGSTFKRPDGNFAGKLIMEAGLAGYRIGGASVSSKHCGFVINDKNATSLEIKQLIDYVADVVYEKAGVKLEPEVIFLGDF